MAPRWGVNPCQNSASILSHQQEEAESSHQEGELDTTGSGNRFLVFWINLRHRHVGECGEIKVGTEGVEAVAVLGSDPGQVPGGWLKVLQADTPRVALSSDLLHLGSQGLPAGRPLLLLVLHLELRDGGAGGDDPLQQVKCLLGSHLGRLEVGRSRFARDLRSSESLAVVVAGPTVVFPVNLSLSWKSEQSDNFVRNFIIGNFENFENFLSDIQLF